MENKKELTLLLEEVADGKKSVEEAVLQLREIPFEDLGYAKTDLHRGMRQGELSAPSVPTAKRPFLSQE